MTNREKIREGLYHNLSIAETADTEPLYRCLPPGDSMWLSLKVTRILSYLHSQGVVFPEEGEIGAVITKAKKRPNLIISDD